MQPYKASLQRTNLFINGKWQPGHSTFPVINPATGEKIADVADAAPDHCLQAIEAADAAFGSWSITPPKQRSELLKSWYALIVQNAEALAALLTSEQGKPLAEAKAEIAYGASFIEWFAEECRRSYGETIPSPVKGKRMLTIRQPVGVVAAITPWNFPVAMVTRKIAPALAAGCTVVLKPAEDTPLCALALAELASQAGIPAGVLNVITTSDAPAIGGILTTHHLIRKLSFTGSTEVGKILMQQCASGVKRLSLELGGNAPVIIFDDADLDTAIAGTLASKYRNAGQTCVCGNRIFVQRGIYDRFLERYRSEVERLNVGNGTDAGVQIGPLINSEGLSKVKRLLEDAVAKGAVVACGGKPHPAGELFFEPTILTSCTAGMDLSREEIFGPVSALYSFETEDEVVGAANGTAYGLAAYFFSRDISRVIRVAERLEYGIIGVNEGIISHAEAPFGGMKESGFGKEGSYYGLEEYLETKYICIGVSEEL
ncbi:MAG TPA: NAD-dependent succinate-semialdehyde dehydrogenase [Chitinophagaceae bacterium]